MFFIPLFSGQSPSGKIFTIDAVFEVRRLVPGGRPRPPGIPTGHPPAADSGGVPIRGRSFGFDSGRAEMSAAHKLFEYSLTSFELISGMVFGF